MNKIFTYEDIIGRLLQALIEIKDETRRLGILTAGAIILGTSEDNLNSILQEKSHILKYQEEGDQLEIWEGKKIGISLDRAKELLTRVVDHEAAGRNCQDTIKHLLWLGFTGEELHSEFGFNLHDVADAEEDMGEYEED